MEFMRVVDQSEQQLGHARGTDEAEALRMAHEQGSPGARAFRPEHPTSDELRAVRHYDRRFGNGGPWFCADRDLPDPETARVDLDPPKATDTIHDPEIVRRASPGARAQAGDNWRTRGDE